MDDWDTTDVEEMAIGKFKEYLITGSRILKPYFLSNDRTPHWDGHIQVVSKNTEDKHVANAKIQVQVKGITVPKLSTDTAKFSIEKDDLQSYLHTPTLYVCCQFLESDRTKYRLFFVFLLPKIVQGYLQRIKNKQSTSVLLHEIHKDVRIFEERVFVFLEDARRQIMYADRGEYTLNDAWKDKAAIQLVLPSSVQTPEDVLKFLTTEGTYLYALVDEKHDISIPIGNSPATFAISGDINESVSVNGHVYYEGYQRSVKNGLQYVSVADDLLKLEFPIDASGVTSPIVTTRNLSSVLPNLIQEAEFMLALAEYKNVTIGKVHFTVSLDDEHTLNYIKDHLGYWKALQEALRWIHITEPLDMSKVTKKNLEAIQILLCSVCTGKAINIRNAKGEIKCLSIGNLSFAVWVKNLGNGRFLYGDVFDGVPSLSYKEKTGEVLCSVYTYLLTFRWFDKLSNIRFDHWADSERHILEQSPQSAKRVCYDVDAMIKKMDAGVWPGAESCKVLLEQMQMVCDALLSIDTLQNEFRIWMSMMRLQVIYRQRSFSEVEIKELERILAEPDGYSDIKVLAALLLDNKEQCQIWLNKCEEASLKAIRKSSFGKFID